MHKGEILKKLREAKGLEQVEAAQKLKIPQSYISNIESGVRDPGKAVFKRMVELYGVPAEIIIWLSADEKNVPKGKLKAFKILKPKVDALIKEFFPISTFSNE